MKAAPRLVLRTVGEIAFVLLLHAALLYGLATKQVVATILSAGDHVPLSYLILAVGFVIVRLFALFLLPGFILQRLVKLAFYFLIERRLVDPEHVGPPAESKSTPGH